LGFIIIKKKLKKEENLNNYFTSRSSLSKRPCRGRRRRVGAVANFFCFNSVMSESIKLLSANLFVFSLIKQAFCDGNFVEFNNTLFDAIHFSRSYKTTFHKKSNFPI